MFKAKVNIEVEIDEEYIADVLCTAFEGGSNYWIDSVTVIKGFGTGTYASEILAAGGKLRIIENEESDYAQHELTREMVVKGIQMFLNMQSKQTELMVIVTDYLDAGNIDANDADSILQYALFGELVYC